MSRRTLLAVVITVLGVLITLYNLRDGLQLSFALLLGVLLIVDGALRFAMLSQEHTERPESH